MDGVVHCAAWTAVDAAEDEDKQEIVRRVNVLGTENIAKVCKKLGIKMMYLSTDYVFDGQGTTPWEPDCKAYKPLNVYGQTKLDGELAVYHNVDKFFIIRIAWAAEVLLPQLPHTYEFPENSPFSALSGHQRTKKRKQ